MYLWPSECLPKCISYNFKKQVYKIESCVDGSVYESNKQYSKTSVNDPSER